MKNIIIESGHGLHTSIPRITDPGAVFRRNGDVFTERNLASTYGKIAVQTLREKNDAKVFGVGVDSEATKLRKISYVNKELLPAIRDPRAILICIHVNAGKGTGAEVWFQKKATNRVVQLAEHVLSEYVAWTGIPRRSIHSSKEEKPWRKLYIDDYKCDAVLIETGFIDSGDLDRFLLAYQNIGQAIAHSAYTFNG